MINQDKCLDYMNKKGEKQIFFSKQNIDIYSNLASLRPPTWYKPRDM